MPHLFERFTVLGHKSESDTEPNIVIFGSTGCGKSSVVNMLLGANKEGAEEPRAKVSSSAKGCTFESKPYLVDCEGKNYKVWDTTGLDEGKEGTVASVEAFDKLCTLIKNLSRRNGGVSLLMFVMRAPRVTETTRRNYQMFYEGFCEKQVPVVIVITGLENEDNMDDWWSSNEYAFKEKQMHFEGAACISAIMGRRTQSGRRVHQETYDVSVPKVKGLIIDHCPKEGWKKKPEVWAVTCWKWALKAVKAKSPYRHTREMSEKAKMNMASLSMITVELPYSDSASINFSFDDTSSVLSTAGNSMK
ncbi:hypothetical protein D9757_013891 [Collybiopsis confluens]|uniref:G domain-containing protein n=1 Tax=Collybiopsis confluens TaxID=2823264 RepID=A0A8H5CMX5_9AGAR|nr:hypothetical protein D9757_013891 [Collybiopsis confluens]